MKTCLALSCLLSFACVSKWIFCFGAVSASCIASQGVVGPLHVSLPLALCLARCPVLPARVPPCLRAPRWFFCLSPSCPCPRCRLPVAAHATTGRVSRRGAMSYYWMSMIIPIAFRTGGVLGLSWAAIRRPNRVVTARIGPVTSYGAAWRAGSGGPCSTLLPPGQVVLLRRWTDRLPTGTPGPCR